ncbi:MAG: hypothetical protein ACFFDY_00610 [Candidatus Thorarchaeota archaeon]
MRWIITKLIDIMVVFMPGIPKELCGFLVMIILALITICLVWPLIKWILNI